VAHARRRPPAEVLDRRRRDDRAAANTAWSAWLTDERRDLRDLVDEAFDLVDSGLRTALPA
jgi:hypothetical protein